MKKLLLILFLLPLCGCYNYIELNELGVVSLLAIDYQDNEYQINLEIRENKKEEEETSKIYKSTGSSLDEAIQNTGLSLNKTLYFVDLDILMLSTDAINNKLDTILDYLTRENNVGINFYLLVDDNIEKTISHFQKEKIIAGKYLKEIINGRFNNTIKSKYIDFLQTHLNSYYDPILPKGKLENDTYKINSASIFKKNKIIEEIPFNYVQTYNLLNNIKSLYLYHINYNNNDLIYKIISSKSKLKFQNNKLIITCNINGIFDEMEKANLKDKEEIKKILSLLENNIKKEITTYIDLSISLESDTLGIKKKYYNETRKEIKSLKNIEYEIILKVNLDRKGLMFYSFGEEYEKDN
ncbi:MAG: Ger(x)C family spore germination C-terminal domain-containing protein [bacterium]|nr:Ger(x)C family spore germination C-terminal domain-containing protein [bacterium]